MTAAELDAVRARHARCPCCAPLLAEIDQLRAWLGFIRTGIADVVATALHEPRQSREVGGQAAAPPQDANRRTDTA